MSDLRRNALITGAASGIGRAILQRLLARGFRVAALDTRRVQIGAEQPNLRSFSLDITDSGALTSCFEELERDFGSLDTLICNAGVGIHERLDQGDPEKWRAVIETNLLGAMRVIRAFTPLMKREDSDNKSARIGRTTRKDIVIVSSITDQKPYPYGGAYVASKAGLSAVADVLRLELMPQIAVSCLRPGMVDTSFFEHSSDRSTPSIDAIGWSALSPEDVASALEFIIDRPQGVVISEMAIQPVDEPL